LNDNFRSNRFVFQIVRLVIEISKAAFQSAGSKSADEKKEEKNPAGK